MRRKLWWKKSHSRTSAALFLLLAACAKTPVAPPAPPPAPELAPAPAPRPEDRFDEHWLLVLETDAKAAGVSVETFAREFDGLAPNPDVVALDRKQPEFTIPFATYVEQRVTPERINMGRAALEENRTALANIGARYGVPAPMILAILGIETNFGRFTGKSDIVRSLATLAYDGRRSDYFRGELIAALQMIEKGELPEAGRKGSWAGAMGHPQFMPSSYQKHAADGDGDGIRDIWTSSSDVFASIGNYFRSFGWNAALPWGYEVILPSGFNAETVKPETPPTTCVRAQNSHSKPMPAADWSALGLVTASGAPLSDPGAPLTLVTVDGEGGRAFLVTPNFRTVLHYNCSNYYALAVSLLADRIGETP